MVFFAHKSLIIITWGAHKYSHIPSQFSALGSIEKHWFLSEFESDDGAAHLVALKTARTPSAKLFGESDRMQKITPQDHQL